MSTYSYIEDLRQKLSNDEIDWQTVLKKLHSSKPWKTLAWQKKRDELLDDHCGSCGSTEGPLVLQHTWHPAPFRELCEQVKLEIVESTNYARKHPYPQDPPPVTAETAPPQPFEIRNSCPKCGSVNVRQYKDGSWKCNYCNQRFNTPVVIEYRKFDEEGWISHLNSKARWEAGGLRKAWWAKFMKKYNETITKRAALLAIDDHERYVELRPDEVVTRCKKCAFLEDKAFTESYSAGVWAERRRHSEATVDKQEGKA